ncbi:MAG: adenylyl-sulfate kinase [Parvibaculum sp.]
MFRRFLGSSSAVAVIQEPPSVPQFWFPEKILTFAKSKRDVEALCRSIPALAKGRVDLHDQTDWLRQVGCPEGDPILPLLVVSARKGVSPDDLAKLRLIKFLNHERVCVIIEQFDEIAFDREQFELMREEIADAARECALDVIAIIPAPYDHEKTRGWYPEALEFAPIVERKEVPCGARFVVSRSAVEKNDWQIEGRLQSGAISAGDLVLASPSNNQAIVAGVTKGDVPSSFRLRFREPFFAEPGEVISAPEGAPLLSDVVCAHVFWQGASLRPGDEAVARFWFGDVPMKVQSISHAIRASELTLLRDGGLASNIFAEVILRADRLLPVDPYTRDARCGQVSIVDQSGAVSLGFIVTKGYADQRRLLSRKSENLTSVLHSISDEERQAKNGHKGGVLWFTGLSGAGKSTLAVTLEKRLFDLGFQVFVLDGDNVRQGLTANLGFSPDDRAENIRRVGEVAALFREAGTIIISSFISPYRSDRDRARHAAFPDFHEIFIHADVKTCIARDPKGLYQRALKGDIRDFTGISAPYEPPVEPELKIDTEKYDVEQCLEQLVNYVETNFRL